MISELVLEKQIIKEAIQRLYGSVIFFEHGMSVCGRSGGCVEHAHMHALPSTANFREHLQRNFIETKIEILFDLQRFSKDTYLFYEDQQGQKFVYTAGHDFPSQFFRRLWAESVGQPDEWDWGVFIGHENIAQTLDDMQGAFSEQTHNLQGNQLP
jgi:hypothetical protein